MCTELACQFATVVLALGDVNFCWGNGACETAVSLARFCYLFHVNLCHCTVRCRGHAFAFGNDFSAFGYCAVACVHSCACGFSPSVCAIYVSALVSCALFGNAAACLFVCACKCGLSRRVQDYLCTGCDKSGAGGCQCSGFVANLNAKAVCRCAENSVLYKRNHLTSYCGVALLWKVLAACEPSALSVVAVQLSLWYNSYYFSFVYYHGAVIE